MHGERRVVQLSMPIVPIIPKLRRAPLQNAHIQIAAHEIVGARPVGAAFVAPDVRVEIKPVGRISLTSVEDSTAAQMRSQTWRPAAEWAWQ